MVPPEQQPPAYELPAYSEVKPVGIPVQLQLDGQTVAATLIQEVIYTGALNSPRQIFVWGVKKCVKPHLSLLFSQPQGKHLVFIGDGGMGGSAQSARPPPPNDYLCLALLGLLCCCFPLGIVALFRSLEVILDYQYYNSTKYSRHYSGANICLLDVLD